MATDPRQPGEWTETEFHTLLAHPHVSEREFDGLLSRSPGAIDAVRQGIHLFHIGRPTHNLLSQLMIDELRELVGKRTCFVCRKPFAADE